MVVMIGTVEVVTCQEVPSPDNLTAPFVTVVNSVTRIWAIRIREFAICDLVLGHGEEEMDRNMERVPVHDFRALTYT
jgi:hypothetical protein